MKECVQDYEDPDCGSTISSCPDDCLEFHGLTIKTCCERCQYYKEMSTYRNCQICKHLDSIFPTTCSLGINEDTLCIPLYAEKCDKFERID